MTPGSRLATASPKRFQPQFTLFSSPDWLEATLMIIFAACARLGMATATPAAPSDPSKERRLIVMRVSDIRVSSLVGSSVTARGNTAGSTLYHGWPEDIT